MDPMAVGVQKLYSVHWGMLESELRCDSPARPATHAHLANQQLLVRSLGNMRLRFRRCQWEIHKEALVNSDANESVCYRSIPSVQTAAWCFGSVDASLFKRKNSGSNKQM